MLMKNIDKLHEIECFKIKTKKAVSNDSPTVSIIDRSDEIVF